MNIPKDLCTRTFLRGFFPSNSNTTDCNVKITFRFNDKIRDKKTEMRFFFSEKRM